MLWSQVELQLPPASTGGSPRRGSSSDLGSFQTTISSLVPRGSGIFYMPFKRGVSTSHSPLGLLKVSPAGLQSQSFWGVHLSSTGPSVGKPAVGLRPMSPWEETLQFYLSSPFWVTHPRVWVSTIAQLHPSYPSYCGSFFISLVVEGLFCQILVFLISRISVNSFNVGRPMRGGELKVFLLHHLG